MTTHSSSDHHLMETGRLVALTDGVFAVAMTLLVLDLRLPAGNDNLRSALKHMLPGFLVYLIVFASVAGYWTIHHATFHNVRYVDGRLVVLSLTNLLFVTLFPVSASIVGAHPVEPLAMAFVSLNSLLYCISSWAVWAYAGARQHFLASDANPSRIKLVARIMLLVAIGLIVAIPLAFLSVYLAYAIWIFYSPIVGWWISRRSRKSSA
jgi:uncharacterized membrane protein